MRGRLIVIEGVDGAGTTTQAGYLYDNLKKRDLPVHRTAQPSSLSSGKFIREILQRKIMNDNGVPPGEEVMSLLFAADRSHQQDVEIAPLLQKGTHVICDRYLYSSVIYQSVNSKNSDAMEWIKTINRHILKPDLVIYLKIDDQVSAGRRKVRGEEAEIFETTDFQKKLIKQYNRIEQIFPDDKIVTMDASQSIEQLGEAAVKAVNLIL